MPARTDYFEAAVQREDASRIGPQNYDATEVVYKYGRPITKQQIAKWRRLQPSLETAFRYAIEQDGRDGVGGREYFGSDMPGTHEEGWFQWGRIDNMAYDVLNYGERQGIPETIMESILVNMMYFNQLEQANKEE